MSNTAGSISFKMIKTLEVEEEKLSAKASLEEERFRKSFQF
jgi:hypothetical protein